MKKKRKKKSKILEMVKQNFSRICLAAMFGMVLIYTAAVLWIFYHVGAEPATLTVSFFALMTGECGMLALIKTTKTKHEKEKEEEEDGDNEPHG